MTKVPWAWREFAVGFLLAVALMILYSYLS